MKQIIFPQVIFPSTMGECTLGHLCILVWVSSDLVHGGYLSFGASAGTYLVHSTRGGNDFHAPCQHALSVGCTTCHGARVGRCSQGSSIAEREAARLNLATSPRTTSGLSSHQGKAWDLSCFDVSAMSSTEGFKPVDPQTRSLEQLTNFQGT